MLENKKRVFWEAFLLTLVVFVLGMLIGTAFEDSKMEEVNQYYVKSEISLMDILAVNYLAENQETNCSLLIESNLALADRVYEEAYLLEKYEESGKLSENLKLAHQKYDILRTFLWINQMKISDRCKGKIDTVVYLYEFEPDDLVKKATQEVWSKILFDLKQEKGKEVILIPIAVNNNLSSLDALIYRLNITNSPAVVINEKDIIYELKSVEDLKGYLD